MKQLDKILGTIEDFLGVTFLAGMVILIFMQVVLRYCFNHALNWSEEGARYLMIWCTGFGISASVRVGANIGIQAIVDALPGKAGKAVRLLCEVLTLLIFAFLTWAAALFAKTAWISGQLAPSLQIPMFYIYLALPVSFGFCVIRQIQVILLEYVSKKAVEETANNEETVKEDFLV